MPALSGTTKDATGALARKLVRVYREDTGALVQSVMSDAVTGAWSVSAADTTKHTVIEYDEFGDIYWPQTKVLLPFSADLLDLRGHTFTANGGATLSAARSVYAGGSSYLGNGTNSYLSAANSTDFDLPVGDFCIECDVYATGDGAIFSKRANYLSAMSYSLSVIASSQTLVFDFSSTGSNDLGVTSAAWVMPIGAWVNIVIERYLGVVTMYINGVSRGSRSTTAASYVGTEPLLIGATKNGGAPTSFLPGNINGLRFTRESRFRGAFTPAALPKEPMESYTVGTQNADIKTRVIPV